MRTLMKVHLPVEASNRAVADGSFAEAIETLNQRLHPEASYFYTEHGRRAALFVFELDDASHIPQIVEPLFRDLHAEVSLTPVLTAHELQRGLEKTTDRARERERELAGARY